MQKQRNQPKLKEKYISLSIFLLAFIPFLHAQEPTYIHYEPGVDVPFSTTYGEIIQDSLGYIWFGTDSGLYQYDGDHFERIPISSDIKDIEVLDLKKDHYGTLWYRTLTGKLCYYSQHTDSITIFNPGSYLDTLNILTFKVQNNHVYFKSNSKNKNIVWVHKIKSENALSSEITPVSRAKGIYTFSLNRNSLLLPHIYSKLGVVPLSGETLSFIPALNGLNTNFINNNKETLLAYSEKEIYSLNNEQLGDKTLMINSFVINNSYVKGNTIWFLTNSGCFKVDRKLNRLDNGIIILPKTDIYSALLDRESGQWFGTNGNGLFYFPPNSLSDYKGNEQLSKSPIHKIHKIQNGPYVIASGKKILLLSPKTLSPLPLKLEFKSRILDIFVERDKIYIRTISNLMIYSFEKQNMSLTLIEQQDNFKGKSILPLGKNNFVVGGFLYLKLLSKTHPTENLVNKRITALYKDTTTSTIWVGSVNDISTWKYKPGTLEKSTKVLNGINNYITMISKDSNNHIWFSTASNGLYEFFNDTSFHYPLLVDNKIKKIDLISCNSPTKVWLSSYNELFSFDKQSKKYSFSHNINKFIKSPIISLWNTNDTLFIGTKVGLFLYFPKKSKKLTKPLIGVESVKINYRDTIILPSYNLQHSQNNIEITFNTLGAFDPLNKTQVYYKFAKSNTWHLAIANHISLPNLAPGKYHIIIKSINQRNQNDYNSKTLNFSIQKPYWKTIWFNSLIALSSIIIIFLWYNNKKKQIIAEKTREQESEKLKSAILQLQMNPHFIFNSMNTIIYYITIANKKKSIQILTKMSRLIRQIFNFSNKSFIPLSSELQFISDYLDMEQERFSEKVKIITTIDPKAHESKVLIPPLMVQPILENSFKHGLFHKKSDGLLYFTVSLTNKGVIFVIEDNGVGRRKSDKKDKKISSYDVISNRIKLINESKGEFSHITAHFFIEDLVDQAQIPIGTKSTLTFEMN